MNNQMQEAPLEYYRDKYRALDPAQAAQRAGIPFDADRGRFTLRALGNTLYAGWPEFTLVPADAAKCPKTLTGFAMRILAIRYILEGTASEPRGEFKSYRELPWGELYDRNFQGRCVKRLAYTFGARLDAFVKAAETLGGTRQAYGDASFDLPFFENIVCRLIIWQADEEFPPSSQFLFSDNTPMAFNAEDLAAVGDVIIGALKELS